MRKNNLKNSDLYDATRLAEQLESSLKYGIERAEKRGYSAKEIADTINDILMPLESLAIDFLSLASQFLQDNTDDNTRVRKIDPEPIQTLTE